MIYSVDFMEMTEKINPLDFTRYLVNTEWNLFDIKKSYIKVFQFEDNDEFYQVTVPMDRELSDYKEAMYRAIKTVSKKEKRSLEEVMLYLLNPNTDIVKVRLDSEGIESGNIFIDDAIKLYESIKKLLVATTLDVINPRRYHQGRIDDVVAKFLADCRFGQTEIGSYVVSVVCPFADLSEGEEYRQLSIFSDEEQCVCSLTRQVTNRMMKNISIIKRYIDEGMEQELLQYLDMDRISINFLEALNGLNLEKENTDVEFIAEWSPVVKNRENIQNDILLTHDYYQPILTIIDKLKDENRKLCKILGRIKKLESSPVVEKRTKGKVSIVYLDEKNRPRTVAVQLDKTNYSKAISAHANGRHVEVTGEFTGGKKSSMICESFSIID